MRKPTAVIAILLFLATVAFAAKEQGSTTLKDVQPAGTTDKKHKKQQYDLSFATSTNDFTCRTSEKEKIKATDWVVGSPINYKVNGNQGEIKSTTSGKSVKCMIVRVAAVTAPAQ
jgi:hypothetical protein